jgi:hypothetical protein
VDSDTVTIFQLLAPTIFVVGALYTLGPMLPIDRNWTRIFVFCVVWLIVGRYQSWRLFVTVLPAHGTRSAGFGSFTSWSCSRPATR